MKYFVYRNLHKPGTTYSIRAMEGEHKGKVIGYSSFFWMKWVEFRVSESGRQRMLRDGYKNVHAGIVGEIEHLYNYERRLDDVQCSHIIPCSTDLLETIKYNPWHMNSFIHAGTTRPITTASAVLVAGNLVSAAFT